MTRSISMKPTCQRGSLRAGVRDGRRNWIDGAPWVMDTRRRNGHPNKVLTCNLWRRTGNIAKRTTAYSMRANTEMSSGNREARTTDADMAAFIESTDVRLHDQSQNPVSGPRNNIIPALSPLSSVNVRARGAVVRDQSVEDEQARRKCPDRIRGRGRRQRLHHRRQRKQRQERQYR